MSEFFIGIPGGEVEPDFGAFGMGPDGLPWTNSDGYPLVSPAISGISAPMQAFDMTWNGMLFSSDSIFEIIKVEGLSELPSVRSGDTAKPLAHGSIPGRDYMESRTITVEVEVRGDSPEELFARMDFLEQRCQVSQDETPFVVTWPGRGAWFVNARLRRRAGGDTDIMLLRGITKYTLQFVASDPVFQSAQLQTWRTYRPTTMPGVAMPVTFPLAFPAAQFYSNGVAQVSVGGNSACSPTITVTGPVTRPTIVHLETGNVFTTKAVLKEGDTLTIDCAKRLLLLNGAPAYHLRGEGSTWFSLLPGENSFRYDGEQDPFRQSEMVVRWRAARV